MMAIKNMLLKVVFSTLLCATVMVSPGVAEFPVNTSGGAHEKAKVALSAKNGFVVVWRDKDNRDILARRYDRTGSALTGEIVVASSGDDEQDPSVCVAEDGGFVAAWHNKAVNDIYAQRYDAYGSPFGTEISVTGGSGTNFGYETSFNGPKNGVGNRQIATQVVLPEDGTVTSITAHIYGNDKDVRYAIYSDNNGEPDQLKAQTAATRMPSEVAWQTIDLPDVTLNAGTYWLALAFDRDNQWLDRATSGGQVRVANHDAERNGYRSPWGTSSISVPYRVAIYATLLPPETDNTSPSVSIADDGSFVVAWENKDAEDVFAQRYDTGGNALGGQIQVTSGADEEKAPSICVADDGSFVVAWENKDADDVFVQRYDAGGSALGGAIQVTSSTDEEKEPSIGVADDGSFVVAWENKDAQDVFAQRYDSDGSVLGAAIQVTTSSDEDKQANIAVSTRGRFVVVWLNKADDENILGQLYLRDGSAVSEWKTEWRVMKWVEITGP